MSDNDFYDPANYHNPNYTEDAMYAHSWEKYCDDNGIEPDYEPDPFECDFDEEEEECLCENCNEELKDRDCDYDGLCEECYTRTYHPQTWLEEKAKRDWEERCNQIDEEEEEDTDQEE